MASTLKVDNLEGSTGSTVTVPTGQTFTVTDGIGIASIPTITVAKGGTNTTSYTAGDVLYASGATTLTKLAKGTAEQVLSMNSGETAPEWTTAAPTAGGTGQTAWAVGDLLYANGVNTLTKLTKPGSTMNLQMTSAGVPSWVAATSGVVKKIHTYQFNTRTASTTAAYNQFTWTAAFVPLDPVNNDMWVQQIVPMWGDGDNAEGFGMRWTKSGTGDYDFISKGIDYTQSAYQSVNSNFFHIAAGTIVAETYTLKFRLDTTASAHVYYCPNSTDDARFGTQTQAELIITEYENP